MKRIIFSVFLLAIFAVLMPAQTPQTPATDLKVGDMAPDLELNDTTGNKFKLSDLRGKKNVVLAFYVLAFTGG
ncbi:redoxin domain-containing protein [Leptolyngbya sp. 7M]|nr:redoxin domain-containing protein [Leptolyngbya sp. 7M]